MLVFELSDPNLVSIPSVKSLFKKAHKANADPYLGLLNH